MKDPAGEVQMAVLGVVKDHARKPEDVHKALEHDFPGKFSFSDVLVCLRFLEQHERLGSERREDGYYFKTT